MSKNRSRRRDSIPGSQRPAIRQALVLRDGTWCQGPEGCGYGIDMEAAGQSWGPSIDHVRAVADGGTNDLENLQLMHAYCNSKKSSQSHLVKARTEREAAKARRAVAHQELMRVQRERAGERRARKAHPSVYARHKLLERLDTAIRRDFGIPAEDQQLSLW